MEIKDLIFSAHSLVEANAMKKISRDDMAIRLGVSTRTYVEYLRGTNAPLAMKALLNLLCQLSDEDKLRLLNEWQSCIKDEVA